MEPIARGELTISALSRGGRDLARSSGIGRFLPLLLIALACVGPRETAAETRFPIVARVPAGPEVGPLFWRGNLIEGPAVFTADTTANKLFLEFDLPAATRSLASSAGPLPLRPGRSRTGAVGSLDAPLPSAETLARAQRKMDLEEALRRMAYRAHARGAKLSTLEDSLAWLSRQHDLPVDSAKFYPVTAIIWYHGDHLGGVFVQLPVPREGPKQTVRPAPPLQQLAADADRYCQMLRKGHPVLFCSDAGTRFLPRMSREGFMRRLDGVRAGSVVASSFPIDSLALLELLNPPPLVGGADQ